MSLLLRIVPKSVAKRDVGRPLLLLPLSSTTTTAVTRTATTVTIRRASSLVSNDNNYVVGRQWNNVNGVTSVERTSIIPAPAAVLVRHDQLQCFPTPQQQQRRNFGHGAKMGKHLERLDELAHEKTRKEAQERRKKKKAAKQQKQQQQKGSPSDHHDDDEDEHHDDEEGEEATVLPDLGTIQESMDHVVEQYRESLRAIRGGEPTVEMFDDVLVDAYGDTQTPISAVAQIVIVSPTLATATCYDPSLAKAVATGIRNRLPNLNPQVEENAKDEGVIKIPIPRASIETRKRTVQELHKRVEQVRQRIRKQRQNALKVVKKGVAGRLEGVSKDEAYDVQQEIETMTETAISHINQMTQDKEHQIMEV